MPEERKIRVLIADDELLARQRLEDLLHQEPDAEIVGQAQNGREAIQAIRTLQPDLVFLDVQMPSYTGTQVVEEIGPDQMPITIFVTAYDQYTLKAFELAALDYLLKPFEDERFEQAFARARRMIDLREVDTLAERLSTLVRRVVPEGSPPPGAASASPTYLERIAVESRGRLRVVPVDQVAYITASGPYAELHVGEDTFLIRERMQTLEDRLDPEQFFRIHRSTIVRLEEVEALLNRGGGDYGVQLKSGERLSLSRSRREELEQRLGLDGLTGAG